MTIFKRLTSNNSGQRVSNKHKILLINDEPAVRFGIRNFLESHGWALEEAAFRIRRLRRRKRLRRRRRRKQIA
jgi:hypothetical protein